MWAMFEAQKEQSLLDQGRSSGYNYNSHQSSKFLKGQKRLAESRGLGMKDYSIFRSPWAQSLEDEVFFETTVKAVGKLVEGDIKICVLYHLLLLLSSSTNLSKLTNTECAQKVQVRL